MNESNLLSVEQRTCYRFAADLFDRVVHAQKFFEKGIQRLIESYGESYLKFANEHIAFLFHRGPDHGVVLEQAVKAYTRYSLEYNYMQEKLEMSGVARYQCSSFDEGRREVYDKPEIMEGYYLEGLYLSLILWPNHYRMLRYFLDQFMPGLPDKGHLLELPIGTGTFATYGLRDKPGWTGIGVDLSPSSLAYSRNLIQYWGLGGRLQAEFGEGQKTLPYADNTFDSLITGELLEHLDDPASFLQECVRITKPGGFLFVTTAIYAAAVDHVYMFEDVASINQMLAGSGSTLWSYLALPVRAAEGLRSLVPTNYASILQKPPAPKTGKRK